MQRLQLIPQQKSSIDRQPQSGMGAAVMILLGLLAVIVILGVVCIGQYNGLVQKDTMVQNQASNIESQMKRRADLIPNLVATVKGYAKHEEKVFGDIAAARSRLLSADVNSNPKAAAQANAGFSSSLGRLMAIAENYPNLKADENFIRLQDELTGTENRINVARVDYNESVRDLNNSVRMFPGNIVAGMTGIHAHDFFEGDASDKVVPTVSF